MYTKNKQFLALFIITLASMQVVNAMNENLMNTEMYSNENVGNKEQLVRSNIESYEQPPAQQYENNNVQEVKLEQSNNKNQNTEGYFVENNRNIAVVGGASAAIAVGTLAYKYSDSLKAGWNYLTSIASNAFSVGSEELNLEDNCLKQHREFVAALSEEQLNTGTISQLKLSEVDNLDKLFIYYLDNDTKEAVLAELNTDEQKAKLEAVVCALSDLVDKNQAI